MQDKEGQNDTAKCWAVGILNGQQRTMLWALLTVRRITRQAFRSRVKPDFACLKKLTTYLDRYAENIHQPNEEHTLFSVVASRGPAADRLIARLRRDHSAMKGYGIRLRTALAHWEQGDPSAGPLTAAVANDYAYFCLRHGRVERHELLPVAQRVLTNSEWLSAGTAFEASADPLAASRNDRDRTNALQRMK